MRGLVLILSAILIGQTSLVTGTAVRGAAERVLFYYAYLAEEFLDEHTIAPRAVADLSKYKKDNIPRTSGVNHEKRCTFNQFLRYIWKESNVVQSSFKDTVEPLAVDVMSDKDFHTLELKQVVERVMKFRYTPPGADPDEVKFPITSLNDAGKTVEGATDWYDSLAKAGLPISRCEAMLDGLPEETDKEKEKKNYGRRLVLKGKQMAQAVVDFRMADMERFRLETLDKLLEEKSGVKDITVGTSMRTNPLAVGDATYRVYNPSKTLSLNKEVANMKRYMEEINNEWRNGKNGDAVTIREHQKALDAAKSARAGSGCDESSEASEEESIDGPNPFAADSESAAGSHGGSQTGTQGGGSHSSSDESSSESESGAESEYSESDWVVDQA